MADPRDVFVGRERVLRELTAALDDVFAGHGRLVTLAGEPAIGKTRTAQELTDIARDRGALVLWATCPEEQGAPPYWLWRQVLRSYAATATQERIRSDLGNLALVLAEVVPEIADRLPGIERPPQSDSSESDRFRLIDSFARFLVGLSTSLPLVVALDNLHWCDPSSLRVLEYLTQEMVRAQILLVATYRDTDISADHPLFLTLGALARHRAFVRLFLRGLNPSATARIIESEAGVQPPPELVRLVQENTEGNPFFVREIARVLAMEALLGPGRMEIAVHLAPTIAMIPPPRYVHGLHLRQRRCPTSCPPQRTSS